MGRFVRLIAKVLGPNAPERPRWKRKRIRAPKRKADQVKDQAQASAKVFPVRDQVRGRAAQIGDRQAANEIAPLIANLLQALTPQALSVHHAMKN